MSLTPEDKIELRAMMAEVVASALDERLRLVGPLAAEWAKAEVDKVVPAVLDGLRVASGAIEKLRKAAADESRETWDRLTTIYGMLVAANGHAAGLDARLLSIDSRISTLHVAQRLDIDQGARIRDSLMPGEKPAVTDKPPAFEGELGVEGKQDADAATPTPTEAE